jgi:hypothetical protein
LFTSDNPQWKRVYDLFASADVDSVVTYDELDAALERDFRADGRPGLDKAVKRLEADLSRTVECVIGKGYRVVRAEEHERLARVHQRKARRQVGKAKRKVNSADRAQLNGDQCKRLDDLEANLAQQATILRRTSRRVEEVDSARKQDTRRVNEELAMLSSAVERLQQRIDSREALKDGAA